MTPDKTFASIDLPTPLEPKSARLLRAVDANRRGARLRPATSFGYGGAGGSLVASIGIKPRELHAHDVDQS
jgi:hypothetical protein